ncbi:MAG: biopolymer transporter ExbD [Ginsengibacter sp.]
MGRAKIKRGSTSVDMTPMCDVAFLLLTFFILAAKFKPDDAVKVVTPTSVSNKVAPQKDYLTVVISKDNKVFLTMDPAIKADVLDELAKERNISFSAQEKKAFLNAPYIASPLSQLNQIDQLKPEQLKGANLPGIPVDSANNELTSWVSAAVNARMGESLNYLIKGDDNSKYETFENVLDAFKKNDIYKYVLVTGTKDIPQGSELYKTNLRDQMSGKKP